MGQMTELFSYISSRKEVLAGAYTAQKAMKDEKIESRLANDTRNTRYVFHCSPVVKHRRCRLLLINRNGNRSP